MSKENGRNEDKWRLQAIELEFQRFGEDKGKYTGKIQFENGEYEKFQFKIHPEMAEKYIELISEDVVKCAESLGQRLIESLGLAGSDMSQ